MTSSATAHGVIATSIAVAERVFATLKYELVMMHDGPTRAEATALDAPPTNRHPTRRSHRD